MALCLIVQSGIRTVLDGAVVAAVIIGREITVSALREWMAQIGARAHVAVVGVRQAQDDVQMVALASCSISEPAAADCRSLYSIGDWLLASAAALTLWSVLDYLRAAWPAMRE